MPRILNVLIALLPQKPQCHLLASVDFKKRHSDGDSGGWGEAFGNMGGDF